MTANTVAQIHYTGSIEIEAGSTGYYNLVEINGSERCPDCGDTMVIWRMMVDDREFHPPYQRCLRCDHISHSMPENKIDFAMSKFLENPNAFAKALLLALRETGATIKIDLKVRD